jgi:hypothetical protein
MEQSLHIFFFNQGTLYDLVHDIHKSHIAIMYSWRCGRKVHGDFTRLSVMLCETSSGQSNLTTMLLHQLPLSYSKDEFCVCAVHGTMNDPNLDHRINIKFFVKLGNDTSETCTMLSKAMKE